MKPNIVVDKKGEPIIMDISLAGQSRRDEDIRLTQTGNTPRRSRRRSRASLLEFVAEICVAPPRSFFDACERGGYNRPA
jgi:hypothetical protein